MVAGNVDMAWAPTPPVINQISNAGVPLVAVYGMENPDWVIATTEAGKTCKDLAGQDVGVDSIGGARSVALRSMLAGGCKEVKLNQVKQIALGSSSGPAMIAGRLKYAVLHLDDLAEIKHQGKTVNILLAMKNTNPTSHYLMLVVRKDNLAKNRDTIVRTVAGLIEAARFMQDPKNADAVADAASRDRPQQGGQQAGAQGIPRHQLLGGQGRRPAAQEDRGGRQADEEDRRHQAGQDAGDLRPARRRERLERRQRDGEVSCTDSAGTFAATAMNGRSPAKAGGPQHSRPSVEEPLRSEVTGSPGLRGR